MAVFVNGLEKTSVHSSGNKPILCSDIFFNSNRHLRQSADTLSATGRACTIQARDLLLKHVSPPPMWNSLCDSSMIRYASRDEEGRTASLLGPNTLVNSLPNRPWVHQIPSDLVGRRLARFSTFLCEVSA